MEKKDHTKYIEVMPIKFNTVNKPYIKLVLNVKNISEYKILSMSIVLKVEDLLKNNLIDYLELVSFDTINSNGSIYVGDDVMYKIIRNGNYLYLSMLEKSDDHLNKIKLVIPEAKIVVFNKGHKQTIVLKRRNIKVLHYNKSIIKYHSDNITNNNVNNNHIDNKTVTNNKRSKRNSFLKIYAIIMWIAAIIVWLIVLSM